MLNQCPTSSPPLTQCGQPRPKNQGVICMYDLYLVIILLGKCNTLVGEALAYTISIHAGCMNTQCTCMFNCLCCIVSVRNLFQKFHQLNINNEVHGHITVAVVNNLFILGVFCSLFMDMYTMQLIM